MIVANAAPGGSTIAVAPATAASSRGSACGARVLSDRVRIARHAILEPRETVQNALTRIIHEGLAAAQ